MGGLCGRRIAAGVCFDFYVDLAGGEKSALRSYVEDRRKYFYAAGIFVVYRMGDRRAVVLEIRSAGGIDRGFVYCGGHTAA